MTEAEAKAAFWAAVADPDPSSIEIAQDVALERGWKLWKLSEDYLLEHEPSAFISHEDAGFFAFTSADRKSLNFVKWYVQTHLRAGVGRLRIRIFYQYHGEKWQRDIDDFRGSHHDRRATVSRAGEESWFALRVMKEADAESVDAGRVAYVINAGQVDYAGTRIPLELNPPMSKNPDDLAAARDKYKEFHRYDPKDVGEFPSSFTIPKRMLLAGKGKWVTYRSSNLRVKGLSGPQPI